MMGGKVKILPLLLLLAVMCAACSTGSEEPNAPQPFSGVQSTVHAPSEEEEENPWEKGGKAPQEYTWEEFLSLSELQQEEFFLWFETPEDFEVWMERVQPQETEASTQPQETGPLPWGEEDKKPDAYTWEEFLALSELQQEEFFLWFETPEAFEAWMEAAQASSALYD